MDLEAQLARLAAVLEQARLLDPRGPADEIFGLAKAYGKDARHFLDQKRREDAIEAFGISWAYLDALLHMGLLEVPEEFLDWFTVD